MALTDDLVAYWKMDEASGTRIDATGRGNDLTPHGAPSPIVGQVGGAAELVTASDDWFMANNDVDLCGQNNDFTWIGWVRVRAVVAAGVATLLTKFRLSDGYYDFNLIYDPGALGFSWLTSADLEVVNNGTGSIQPERWYCVEAYKDSVNEIIGLSVNTMPVTGAITNNPTFTSNSPLYIGGDIGDTPLDIISLADFDIDACGFWHRIFTNTERAQLYNHGLGLSYPLTLPLEFFRATATAGDIYGEITYESDNSVRGFWFDNTLGDTTATLEFYQADPLILLQSIQVEAGASLADVLPAGLTVGLVDGDMDVTGGNMAIQVQV